MHALQEDDGGGAEAAPAPGGAAPLPQPKLAPSASGSNSRLATIKGAGPSGSSSGSGQEPPPAHEAAANQASAQARHSAAPTVFDACPDSSLGIGEVPDPTCAPASSPVQSSLLPPKDTRCLLHGLCMRACS